jgi:hypothetical protein
MPERERPHNVCNKNLEKSCTMITYNEKISGKRKFGKGSMTGQH